MKYFIKFSFVLMLVLFTLTPFLDVQAQSGAQYYTDQQLLDIATANNVPSDAVFIRTTSGGAVWILPQFTEAITQYRNGTLTGGPEEMFSPAGLYLRVLPTYILVNGVPTQVPPGYVPPAGGAPVSSTPVYSTPTSSTPSGTSSAGSGSCQASLSTTMQYGNRGGEVLELQNFLVSQGLLGDESTSGYFGPLTKAAVTSFQSSNGLTADGVVGPATRAKINSMCGGGTSGIPAASAQSSVSSNSSSSSTANVNLIASSLGAGAYRLSWTSTGVTSCTSNDFYINPDNTSTSGSASVNISENTTFSIACVHSRGIAEGQVTVYVSSGSGGGGTTPPYYPIPPTGPTAPTPPSAPTTGTGQFKIGEVVQVVGTGVIGYKTPTITTLYDAYDPQGNPIGGFSGTQWLNGSSGVIVAGPTAAMLNGVSTVFWKVNFSNSNGVVYNPPVPGWIAGQYLVTTASINGDPNGPAPVISSFTAPAPLTEGFFENRYYVALNWATTNASVCTGDWTSATTLPTNSSTYVKPSYLGVYPGGVTDFEINDDTLRNLAGKSQTYKLKCTGNFKSTEKTLTLNFTKPATGVGEKVRIAGINVGTYATAGVNALLPEHLTQDGGTVIAGPVTAMLNGVSTAFWNIDFNSGVDGWVAQQFIETMPYAPFSDGLAPAQTNPNGTTTGLIPLISNLNPSTVPPGGTVTILGLHFDQTSKVFLSSTGLTPTAVSSFGTSLSFMVPNSTLAGPYSILVSNGLAPNVKYSSAISLIVAGSAGTGSSGGTTGSGGSTGQGQNNKFNIGDKVAVVGTGVNARATASTTGAVRGVHNTGDKGTITGGPTVANGYTWWNVSYGAMGGDGWTSEQYLQLDSVTPPPVSGKFKNGDRVAASGSNVNTRTDSSATSAVLGVHNTGDRGILCSDAIASGGLTWYCVNFNTGADGYVAEQYLVADVPNTGDVVTTSSASKIYSFTANPSTITSGQSTTLSWSADAHNCGILDGTTGLTAGVGGSAIGSYDPATAINGMFPATAGTAVVSPASTWTYTIQCNKTIGGGGQGGSPVATAYVTQTVTITVNEGTAPTISSYTASPVGSAPVKSVNLSWTADASSCRVEQETDQLGNTSNPFAAGVSQVIWTGAGSGSMQVSPKSSGVFILVCKKNNKTVVQSLPVTVEYTNNDPATLSIRSELSNPSNNPVTVDVKINGSDGIVTTKAGVPFTYSWSSSNTQMCFQSDPVMSGVVSSGSGSWTKNLYTLPSPGQWHLDVNTPVTFTVTCRGRNGPYIEGQYNYISASDTVMIKLVP